MTDQQTPNNNNQNLTPNEDGVIDIPVRISENLEETDEMIQRLKQEERDTAKMIEEYEDRYGANIDYNQEPMNDSQSRAQYGAPKAKRDGRRRGRNWFRSMRGNMPPRHRYPHKGPNINPADITDSERTWAAIAHLNAILTFIVFWSGPTVIVPLLVPLAIFLLNRRNSEYVAFHALQAFTMQALGSIGVMILAFVGGFALIAGIVVSAITIIGIPIAIVLALLLAAFSIIMLGAPLVMTIYSCIAAYAAWRGRSYRYPYVADWVDDQLDNGYASVTI